MALNMNIIFFFRRPKVWCKRQGVGLSYFAIGICISAKCINYRMLCSYGILTSNILVFATYCAWISAQLVHIHNRHFFVFGLWMWKIMLYMLLIVWYEGKDSSPRLGLGLRRLRLGSLLKTRGLPKTRTGQSFKNKRATRDY